MSMKLGGVSDTSWSSRSSTRPDSVPSGAENSPVPNRPPYCIEKITAAIERMDAARTNHRKRYTKRPQAANISTYPLAVICPRKLRSFGVSRAQPEPVHSSHFPRGLQWSSTSASHLSSRLMAQAKSRLSKNSAACRKARAEVDVVHSVVGELDPIDPLVVGRVTS